MSTLIKLKYLSPDPRSANRMDSTLYTKLVANIEAVGHIQPLTVRPGQEPDNYILIDGHYRLKALQELGWVEAPCECWDMDDQQAGLLLASLNRLRGQDQPMRRAELIDGLLESYDKALLASILPESEAELEDLLSLLQFEEEELLANAEQAIADEAASVPVVLHFVLNQDEAARVESRLRSIDPDNANRALLLLCQQEKKDG